MTERNALLSDFYSISQSDRFLLRSLYIQTILDIWWVWPRGDHWTNGPWSLYISLPFFSLCSFFSFFHDYFPVSFIDPVHDLFHRFFYLYDHVAISIITSCRIEKLTERFSKSYIISPIFYSHRFISLYNFHNHHARHSINLFQSSLLTYMLWILNNF